MIRREVQALNIYYSCAVGRFFPKALVVKISSHEIINYITLVLPAPRLRAQLDNRSASGPIFAEPSEVAVEVLANSGCRSGKVISYSNDA